MAQNDRRGGSTGNARPMTENEQMSLVDKLKTVLNALVARKDEIAAVLPPDLSFDRFHATVNQALRNNPDIFKATTVSIINACVKAAYDGCRLDGREAALVLHKVKVSKSPERWEDQAQYFPMVFGIIQQILRGGEILAIDVDVIKANDEYQLVRGTNPGIHHLPLLTGDRGPIVAAYSVAHFKSGAKTFAYMTKAELDDVKQEAKTKFVWERWEGEMSKKSVVRRHRKLLPLGDRDIVDIEANELFPQFAGNQAPALGAPPPRPTRNSAALSHQENAAGVPLDFGNSALEREGVVIDQGKEREHERQQVETRTKPVDQPAADLPEDEAAWASWTVDVERRINAAQSPATVENIRREEAPRIDAANKERGDFIKSLITDRLADLASEAAGSAASAGED